MNRLVIVFLLFAGFVSLTNAQSHSETVDTLQLSEVVVTGTRNAIDVRHLPMTVTVINRETIEAQHQTNVLPLVMQEVPGLMLTSRSMIGYGVSTGAAVTVGTGTSVFPQAVRESSVRRTRNAATILLHRFLFIKTLTFLSFYG